MCDVYGQSCVWVRSHGPSTCLGLARTVGSYSYTNGEQEHAIEALGVELAWLLCVLLLLLQVQDELKLSKNRCMWHQFTEKLPFVLMTN